MSVQQPSGGFSLFPNTIVRPPSRTLSRPGRGVSPQPGAQDSSPARRVRQHSPSQNGRSTPQGEPATTSGQWPLDDRQETAVSHTAEDPIIQQPARVAVVDAPARTETAFSEAHTLVRSDSHNSRSSIAKRPISFSPGPGANSGGEGSSAPALRSMFPQYNPDLPPDRQEYYPTQTSPAHIPRGVISRPLYSPIDREEQQETRSPATVRSPVRSPPVRSPMSGNTTTRWPPRAHEQPQVPDTSSTEELRSLWKVTNGWKANGNEGRVFCLKMSAEKDSPIYTLSSSTQPFYNLRVDPTSASAHISLSRHDPNRPCKSQSPPTSKGSSSSKDKLDNKSWQEVLNTTLEEDSRRFTPDDGLVALLYPSGAAKAALDRPDDPNTIEMAERECARLVWDVDSSNYYLVHPALELPFCITVERSPAWSRTEYTLEHLESPQHLARLTRDGTGTGWLEVDTAIAAKIDAVYLVDVAVAALMLIAHKDADGAAMEFFEPPPVVNDGVGNSRRFSRMSKASKTSKMSRREDARRAKTPSRKRTRMEEFELDIESQTSELKKLDGKDKEKIPGTARGLIKLLTVTFKCFIWILTIGFKALTGCITILAKCLTSEKL